MGNSDSIAISEEALDEYVQLTYLNKSEIRRIYKLLDNLEPGILQKDLHYRFSLQQIDKILPQIHCNPFRDSIYRVFSSKRDDHLCFEDILDLCSAFSANCPQNVRAAWAFEIFDLGGNNQICLDDLTETVQRLTGFDENEQFRIDRKRAENIAQTILREMDIDGTGSIVLQEFIHMLSRIPEFAHTFQFKV